MMIMLYDYRPKDWLIETQYGTVSYKRWLEEEKKRIGADPDRRAVVEKTWDGKLVALFVNEVKGCECEVCRKVQK